MAMKSSSVCALEPEKITKTKWAQYYGTPCIYYVLFVPLARVSANNAGNVVVRNLDQHIVGVPQSELQSVVSAGQPQPAAVVPGLHTLQCGPCMQYVVHLQQRVHHGGHVWVVQPGRQVQGHEVPVGGHTGHHRHPITPSPVTTVVSLYPPFLSSCPDQY